MRNKRFHLVDAEKKEIPEGKHPYWNPEEIFFSEKNLAVTGVRPYCLRKTRNLKKRLSKKFQVNPYTGKGLFSPTGIMLAKAQGIAHVYLLPSQPYELSGHADGMVRLLDDHTLLVAGYQTESPSWRKKYAKALLRTGLKVVDFPGVATNIKNEDGDFTALAATSTLPGSAR